MLIWKDYLEAHQEGDTQQFEPIVECIALDTRVLISLSLSLSLSLPRLRSVCGSILGIASLL
jgi:hypothetical protein